MAEVFFAYPSKPELSRETLARASAQLGRAAQLSTQTWEELRVSGHIIIDRVIHAIDNAAVSVFDVSAVNENVMFELGYAITSNSRVWLVRDESDAAAERRWNDVGILTNVGYLDYQNSGDIVRAFLAERPDTDSETLFEASIEPVLDPVSEPMLFYVRNPANTDAERDVSRHVHRQRRAGVRCIVADPRESSVEPLTWYAYQCYQASAVLVHFARPGRRGAETHNARCALIAGLARGFGRPLLMLAEEGYATPIDYQDLLYTYDSARDAKTRTRYWLQRGLSSAYAQLEEQAANAHQRSLSTELGSIRLGEPIAENEADKLSQYFVPTQSYAQVLSSRTNVFVGRKGTGKSANLIRAADELSEDKRTLVCVVRPSDYDLDGLLRLLRAFRERDAKGYLVESLWKFLLLSEIALALHEQLAEMPAGITPGTPGWDLDQFLRGPGAVISKDFAVRLERTVAALSTAVDSESLEMQRTRISEALHSSVLRDLRDVLAKGLADKRRVAVLIDNLDQAWDSTADLDQLSALLLGLLNTVGRVSEDLAGHMNPEALTVTLGVFIRSDIYHYVASSAREPDKLPSTRLSWKDRELLLQVVEQRYAAGRAESARKNELWEMYFTPRIGGVPTPTYLASRVLPRPRDIVYLCNAAIDAAVRKRHTKVTAEDITEAEQVYSQFACDALAVEAISSLPQIGDILYGFAGVSDVLRQSDVIDALRAAGVPSDRHRDAIHQLVLLTFLGLEVAERRFEFAEDPRDERRFQAMARRYRDTAQSEPRFRIHPAFQAHLGISPSTPVPATTSLKL